MLSQPTIATLNHLLTQSGWALPRLAKFHGRTARFRIAPFTLTCTIQQDGSLQEAAADTSADAELNIAPSLLPRLALQDEAAYDLVRCNGDAGLVEEIMFIARNLRWDAAEDLSKITGDIAAERIVNFASAVHKHVRGTALNLSQAASEYWTEERPIVAASHKQSDFAQDVEQVRKEVDDLERRIDALGANTIQ